MTSLLGDVLLCERLIDLKSRFLWLSLLKDEHVHLVVEQLAGETNIYGCLYFVTSEYPELHPSHFDVIDCPTNIDLKFVLNSS